MNKLSAVKGFNLRALPLLLVSLVAGILYASIDVWWVAALLFVLTAGGIVTLTCFAPRRRMLGVACLVFLSVSLLTVGRMALYRGEVAYFEGSHVVAGRVASVQCDEEGYVTALVMDNIAVDGEGYRGKMKVDFATFEADEPWLLFEARPSMPAEGAVILSVGYEVCFTAEVQTYTLAYFDSVSMHNAVRRVYYHIAPTEGSCSAESVYRKPTERVRYALYSTLRANMSAVSAGMAYALLTGDTSLASPAVVQGYRHSGAAHLLAVSGLHVGLLAAALAWLLRLMRCPRYVRTGILTALLAVYAWLCGGTPSVVRATTVVAVTSLVRDVGCHRDKPSLLALAGLLMLTIDPWWLFDVSFLLSYGAYAGIVLLYDVMRHLVRRVPGKAGDALALNLAVTLSILPLGIYFYGGISLFSVPFNFLLVPVMSAVYLLLAVLALLSFIPHWGILLRSVDYLLYVVNCVVAAVGGVGYVRCRCAVWQIPVYYAGVGLASPYCLWRPAVRYGIAGTIGVMLLLCVLL